MKSNRGRSLTLGQIAEAIGAQLEGDSSIIIERVAPISSADVGEIAFLANRKYAASLESTRASAVILDFDTPCAHCAVLRHKNPYLAFAHALDLIHPEPLMVPAGIDRNAVIEDNVQVDDHAAIGPLCHVRARSSIGAGTQLVSSVFVGRGVVIGKNCLIYPGVRIMDGCSVGDNVIVHSSTVIGSDGFGFAPGEGGLKKIRQIGWVEIGDDVEIGSNVSIDRGALGPTRIGRGTKIDNLVQVAHNVEIGEHTVIVAQVGISGSTKVGSGVQMAGQVGVVGHVEIGDGVRIGAQSGVSGSVAPGMSVFGSPAREAKAAMREAAAISRLPELLKRVRALEKKLADN